MLSSQGTRGSSEPERQQVQLPWLMIGIFAITIATLALHPISDCFDCEGPGALGVNDATYARDTVIFEAWFVVASLLAGTFRIRWGLLVPAALLFARLATEHLGGLPWWSLRENEGPMILLLGLPSGYILFAVGLAAGALGSRRKVEMMTSPSYRHRNAADRSVTAGNCLRS